MSDIVSNPEPSEDDLSTLEQLRYVETLIGHEIALIGNRMTWFTVSQSFLFGAYASVATDPVRLASAYSKLTDETPAGTMTLTAFLILMPLVGIIYSLAAYVSVQAANRVLLPLTTFRGNQLEKLNRRKANGADKIPVIGDTDQRTRFGTDTKYPVVGETIFWGQLPQFVLPLVMVVVWVVALAVRLEFGGITFGSP